MEAHAPTLSAAGLSSGPDLPFALVWGVNTRVGLAMASAVPNAVALRSRLVSGREVDASDEKREVNERRRAADIQQSGSPRGASPPLYDLLSGGTCHTGQRNLSVRWRPREPQPRAVAHWWGRLVEGARRPSLPDGDV